MYIRYIYIYIFIYINTESSVVSAHVLGSLLLPLFSMNLPIQKKYGCTCHFNIASPTGKPQEQNSLHKIKLHNWKLKKQKNKKKTTKIPEKGWGAHSCWIFVFFGGVLCFFGGFAYCTACL